METHQGKMNHNLKHTSHMIQYLLLYNENVSPIFCVTPKTEPTKEGERKDRDRVVSEVFGRR